MATITTRVVGEGAKGSPLTNSEVDNNFINLNTAKYESGDNISVGSITATGNMNFSASADRSEQYLQIGSGMESGYAYIDLVGDDTYTDYGLRLIRGNSGANATSSLQHRGTGDVYFSAQDGSNSFVFNEVGVDTDFRVESNDYTHALFVDAGNNRVGIRTSSPTAGHLQIGSQTGASGAQKNVFLNLGGTYSFDDATSNQYQFIGFTGTTFSTVDAYSQTSGEVSKNFYMGLAADNAYFNNNRFVIVQGGQERLKLDGYGSPSMVINEGGVDYDFRIESDTNTNALFVDAGTSRVGINGIPNAGAMQIFGAGNQNGGNLKLGDNGDGTAKWSYLTGSHYNGTTESEGVALIGSYAAETATRVIIGGAIYETNPSTSIEFYTHTDTIHHLGGTRKLLIGSSELAANVDGLDYDFRVASDANSHAFFIDAASGKVGVGDVNTATRFKVTGTNEALLRVENTDTYSGDAGAASFTIGNWDGERSIRLEGAHRPMFITNYYNPLYAGYNGEKDVTLASASGAVFNETGNSNVDFRVESDSNTHMLTVNAGDNCVTIGTPTALSDADLNVRDLIYAKRIRSSNYAYITPTSGNGVWTWIRIAKSAYATNGGQRSAVRITASTTGGNFGPSRTEFKIFKDWSADASLDVAQSAGSNYINDARLVRDDTHTYLEVYTYWGSNSTFLRVIIEEDQWFGAAWEPVTSNGASDGEPVAALANPSYTFTPRSWRHTGTHGAQWDKYAQADKLVAGAGAKKALPSGDVAIVAGTDLTGTAKSIEFWGTTDNREAVIQSVNAGSYNGGLNFFTRTGTTAGTGVVSQLDMGTFGSVFNNASNVDLDFRVESDGQSHALMVDSGNNAVGVMNSTPRYPLDVVGTTYNKFNSSFGQTINVGQWTGIHIGYKEPSNDNYRKTGIAFERTTNAAAGHLHFLNDVAEDNNNADLSNSIFQLRNESNGAPWVTRFYSHSSSYYKSCGNVTTWNDFQAGDSVLFLNNSGYARLFYEVFVWSIHGSYGYAYASGNCSRYGNEFYVNNQDMGGMSLVYVSNPSNVSSNGIALRRSITDSNYSANVLIKVYSPQSISSECPGGEIISRGFM